MKSRSVQLFGADLTVRIKLLTSLTTVPDATLGSGREWKVDRVEADEADSQQVSQVDRSTSTS